MADLDLSFWAFLKDQAPGICMGFSLGILFMTVLLRG